MSLGKPMFGRSVTQIAIEFDIVSNGDLGEALKPLNCIFLCNTKAISVIYH